MPRSQPTSEMLQQAVAITAQNLIEAISDRFDPNQVPVRKLGDYVICSGLFVNDSLAELFGQLAVGLEEAGADEEIIATIGIACTTETQRQIFSLNYIPSTEHVRGIRRTSRSIEIDEFEFVSGILENNLAAAS
jgi:hypothetical protein